jgi:hypothetical protein
MLYRNYRKSSEAQYRQINQKVATKNDIQCIFQFLQEPVNEKERYREFFYVSVQLQYVL